MKKRPAICNVSFSQQKVGNLVLKAMKLLLYQRSFQRTEINYVLVTDQKELTPPFVPPWEFDANIIEYISRLPKDILQIAKPLPYYENQLLYGLNNPYRFHVKYTHNLLEYLEYIAKDSICLFFIDGRSVIINEIMIQFKSYHSDLHFYHLYHFKDKNTVALENVVTNPNEFLNKILEKQEVIFELLKLPFKRLIPEDIDYNSDFLDYPNFVPAQTNYRIANSIIGNFFLKQDDIEQEEESTVDSDELASHHKEATSFKRQQIILKKIKKVDFFRLICFEKGLVKQVHEIDPFFSPLILVAPFQNPDIKEYFRRDSEYEEVYKLFTESLDIEQSENYINFGKISNGLQASIITHFVVSKNRFLDDVALLHSSFNFSPILRLPVQGKSIYKALSFFRTDAISAISQPKNKKGLRKTIKRFGKELQMRTLSQEAVKGISKQNRQIVAITDMPIEWLDLDGVPLAFTHDVCRLPETSLAGLMATFVTNEQAQYEIPKDILKKTLVIFGSDDVTFKRWRPIVNALSKTAGFTTRICLNKMDLKKAVDEIQPHLLIFDCHGGYDKQTKASLLYLGNEELSGDDIVANNITAPLVFLSACNTAPTYGTINTIANAFFENKALAVTTTYLPINVNSGSVLYIRLLNNLQMASNTPIHPNWLAFVAHVIRTSAVSAAFEYFLSRKKTKKDIKAVMGFQATLYTKLMSFYLRRKLYNEIDHVFKELSGEDRAIFSSIIPEYLFYSNLGRSDLIKFEVWHEKYIEKNKT